MIESTFVLLKGIGEYTERRLWDSGVVHWEDFLRRASVPGISSDRKRLYDGDLEAARRHLQLRHARYFTTRLKPRDHWRLFAAFRASVVFLDIETTGTTPDVGEVTVVGLYASGRMTSLVRGESLTESRLSAELARYDLIVTFFGRVFDLPYLRAKFPGLILDQPHLDLCFAARRLALRGGLKQIESAVGILRPPDLRGLDGWDAVRLWQTWRRGDSAALETLLRYNAADTRNLEPLAEVIYAGLSARYCPAAGAQR